MTTLKTAEQIQHEWNTDPRWAGITRNYTAADVVRLRGTIPVEHSIAKIGAQKLWRYLQEKDFVNALGALTGNQAMQQVKAGLNAIYLSGWQVAADANLAGQMYPDQSLYPADSVPAVVRRINNALLRADQLHHAEGDDSIDFLQPIVADAEAGFGGVLNAFELMKAMIEAGAAGVHFEDQLAAVKKCGHMGGKVLVPTREAVEKLNAARLAADVMGVPTLLVARTDAEAADLLTSDVDDNDKPFCTGERTVEGFYKVRNGLEQSISRGLAYAPYADMLWFETAKPDLSEARQFAEAIHARFPGKRLAYNCSPSFNWKRHLNDAQLAGFQREVQPVEQQPFAAPAGERARADQRRAGRAGGRRGRQGHGQRNPVRRPNHSAFRRESRRLEWLMHVAPAHPLAGSAPCWTAPRRSSRTSSRPTPPGAATGCATSSSTRTWASNKRPPARCWRSSSRPTWHPKRAPAGTAMRRTSTSSS